MKVLKTIKFGNFGVAAISVAATLSLSSCGVIYEDLDPCPPTGASVRFVYDYNMEYANAFHSQVDCLNLHVYDNEGKFVASYSETSSALADENYRMPLELPAGHYRLVAHGGLECENSSFAPVKIPESGHLHTDLSVAMHPHCLTDDSHRNLHKFFYGALEIDIVEENMTEATVKMMRNTNDVQVALQHLHGTPVDVNDFNFAIYDDNTLFRHDNELIPAGEVKYTPWATANRTTGTIDSDVRSDEEQTEVQVALAEMSVSRLVTSNQPRLHITKASDGSTVVDIPLINYMLLYKSHNITNMSNQEYLDRENQWSILFFLDETKSDLWVKNVIKINDWTVRINDVQP